MRKLTTQGMASQHLTPMCSPLDNTEGTSFGNQAKDGIILCWAASVGQGTCLDTGQDAATLGREFHGLSRQWQLKDNNTG